MFEISAIVLVKNDEQNIKRCLDSLKFCDEVIVLTGGISDFSEQRNLAMKKANKEWVLFIDSDEEVTVELKQEIQALIQKNIQCFYLKRRDFFWGKELKYGETAKARNKGIIRLVKKGSGKWEGKVHEEYKVKSQKSKVKSLNGYLDHYPHQTVKEFINSVNFYSSLRADELFSSGKKTNILEIIFFPLGKFVLTYFLKRGFLDGPAGFVYSFMMSFHSFLVRIKLYQSYIKNSDVSISSAT